VLAISTVVGWKGGAAVTVTKSCAHASETVIMDCIKPRMGDFLDS
jgi:hypothetical protein